MDKYEEALKLARVYYSEDCNQFLDTIFPELRESEDERVIKALETFINQPEIADKITFEARILWLSWLEKQKKCHPDDVLNCTYQEGFEDGFKAGREVERRNSSDDDFMKPRMQEPWNKEKQKEQKPAEDINYPHHLSDQVAVMSTKDAQDKMTELLGSTTYTETYSKTNELVFQDICKHLKEEGYGGWVVLLKALRNGEFYSKQEWNEEDENVIKTLIRELRLNAQFEVAVRKLGLDYIQTLTALDKCRRLYSRSSWKPSEEQMSILKKAVEHYRNDWVGATIKEQNTLTSLYEQLKKLKSDEK
jgi:hypothetical protein